MGGRHDKSNFFRFHTNRTIIYFGVKDLHRRSSINRNYHNFREKVRVKETEESNKRTCHYYHRET